MKVKINGLFLDHFTALKISRSLDSIASTFSLAVRFNPENDTHKELFKPLQYLPIEIYSDKNELMFTGTILNHSFQSDNLFNLLQISGYSKCGILEDVTIPPSMYPLESNNKSLKEIADSLCGAYGIDVIYLLDSDSDINGDFNKNVGTKINAYKEPKKKRKQTTNPEVNRTFKKTTASATDSVKSYISKLTSQRNILLSHNNAGDVVMFKPNLNAKPKYYFSKDNTIKMSSSWNGQGMHSEINVVRQPSAENAGVSTADKINNPLIGKYRPTTKVLSSGEDTDTSKAANNELSAELQNIKVTVDLQGLFEDILPGDLINIHNHSIYSFAYSRWIVSSIDLSIDEKSTTTSLDLVLPETYSGDIPKPILFYYSSHQRHN
jgi:prophage tail gpP-like protein